MADPLTATVLGGKAAFSIFGGLAKSAAQKTEAKQLELQAQQQGIRASQIAHSTREQLNESLGCLLYTSPSPRDGLLSRMPSSA